MKAYSLFGWVSAVGIALGAHLLVLSLGETEPAIGNKALRQHAVEISVILTPPADDFETEGASEAPSPEPPPVVEPPMEQSVSEATVPSEPPALFTPLPRPPAPPPPPQREDRRESLADSVEDREKIRTENAVNTRDESNEAQEPPPPAALANSAASSRDVPVVASPLHYISLFLQALEPHKRYPYRARRKRMEGRVVIAVRIARNGSVVAQEIRQESGHDLLDEETLAMLKRAAPFPTFPPDMSGDVIEMVVPIEYALPGSR